MKKQKRCAGTSGIIIILILVKIMENEIYDILRIQIPSMLWWGIVIALVIVTLFLFPFSSLNNPKKKLKYTIRWIDFSNVFEIEPFLTMFLKIENQSDIKQIITTLKGIITYSASYQDNTFPEHPLASPFNETQIEIEAKTNKIIPIRLQILPESATRFKKYIGTGEYIFWSGLISASVSAKVWNFERGGHLKDNPLPKFPQVPTSRIFEGIENL